MMGVFKMFLRNLTDFGLEYFKKYYGFYNGICMDNEDPEEQGRIMLKVPIVTGDQVHAKWAEPIMLAGSEDGGVLWVPEKFDPVYVTFINGNPQHPRYFGGHWPKPGGVNHTPKIYTDGKPTKKTFKTHAGHEITFDDDPEKLSVKMIWRDKEKSRTTFFALTPEGGIQMANHKGCMIELRANDDDELVMIVDKTKNLFTLDKDGIKMIDAFNNAFTMAKDLMQFIGAKDIVINAPSVNIKTGGVTIGDVATDSAVKGTTFLTWWTTVFFVWLNSHIHPTGVGPSGAPIVPSAAPPAVILTDKLKMQ